MQYVIVQRIPAYVYIMPYVILLLGRRVTPVHSIIHHASDVPSFKIPGINSGSSSDGWLSQKKVVITQSTNTFDCQFVTHEVYIRPSCCCGSFCCFCAQCPAGSSLTRVLSRGSPQGRPDDRLFPSRRSGIRALWEPAY